MHSHSNNTGFALCIKQVSTTDYRICCSTGNGTGRTYCTYYGTTNIKDSWHHLALTYDNTLHVFKLWVDGICEKIQNYTNAARADIIKIFDWSTTYNDNRYQPACLLNDVRIYDHVLSDKEIEEIAKGLVLHYKLDDAGLANPNLITNFDTSFLTYNIGQTTLFTNQMNNGTQEIVSNIEGAQKCLHFHGAGGQNRAYKTLNLSNGKIYTISLDYYSPNNQPTAIHGELAGGNYSWTGCGSASYSVNRGKWQRLIYTTPQLTSDTTLYYFIHCINGYDCYIKNIKVEEGSSASLWCNYKTDIIYDSSGYNNNGTIVGSLTAVTDSARYNCATYFVDGVNDHIVIDSTNFSKDSITMSIWFKTSNTAPAGHNHWLFGRYLDYQISIKDSNGHLYAGYHINGERKYKEIPINLIDGLWHMATSTYDGSNIKIYVDGQLKNSVAATGQLSSVPDLYIGVQNNNKYGVKECNLSDARIYATALTDKQIKELYNTSATIDNLGNIHTREFDENSNLNITNTGLFQATEIKDGDYKIASILKDTNSIQGNHLYEY